MRSAAMAERMRCAVEGCRPVYCATCFRPIGSGCSASTSSSFIIRAITWMGFLCSSLLAAMGVGIVSHDVKHSAPMTVVTCIEDLRQMAKKRVAKAIFDYVDRGAYEEDTLRANKNDLDAIKFRQRVAVDVDQRSTRTTMLGEEV